jgi:hypothetical protein
LPRTSRPNVFTARIAMITFAAMNSTGAAHSTGPVAPRSTMRSAVVGNAATPKLKAQYASTKACWRIHGSKCKSSTAWYKP